jgi:hypothetical protein
VRPSKGNVPKNHPDLNAPIPKSGLEVELDDLVRRMIAEQPTRADRIREYAARLRRAFLGRDTHAQTKSALAAREEGWTFDDLLVIDTALDLLEQPDAGGDILAHGLSGKIHRDLKERRRRGDKDLPQWSVKTIRRKLVKRVRKLDEEMR